MMWSRIALWKDTLAVVWKVAEKGLDLRLAGSFLLNICLSLEREFSDKQKEVLLNSVLYRSLNLLNRFTMVLWRGLNQSVLLNVLVTSIPTGDQENCYELPPKNLGLTLRNSHLHGSPLISIRFTSMPHFAFC